MIKNQQLAQKRNTVNHQLARNWAFIRLCGGSSSSSSSSSSSNSSSSSSLFKFTEKHDKGLENKNRAYTHTYLPRMYTPK